MRVWKTIPAKTRSLDRAKEVIEAYKLQPGEYVRLFPMSKGMVAIAVYKVEDCELKLSHFIGPAQ